MPISAKIIMLFSFKSSLAYKDYNSTIQELLDKGKLVSIHQRALQVPFGYIKLKTIYHLI